MFFYYRRNEPNFYRGFDQVKIKIKITTEIQRFVPNGNGELFDYSHVIFGKDLWVAKSTYTQNIDLRDCHFEGDVVLKLFSFHGIVDFSNSRFSKQSNLIIESGTFESHVIFESCNFHNSVYINNIIFNGNFNWYKSIFNSGLIIKSSGSKSGSHINFEQSQFNSYLDIASIPPKQELIFYRATFKQSVDILVAKIQKESQKFSFKYKDIYDFRSNIEFSSSSENLSESFRRIKQSYLSSGNRFEALNFHSLEHLCQLKSLSNKTILDRDKLTLYFNLITSNFGTDWARALYVIIIYSIISFTGFMGTLSMLEPDKFQNQANTQLFSYFIDFINPIPLKFEPFDINLGFMSIILFLNKAIIASLIYQFVQAFRKFGRI